ncbi:Nif3-like dinuclear metal center hexameric protein [Pediococcus ethanolidurans]|uniref:Nif3-like dinuclear metal center hexameric protein n=2 Tax=Pediococcus ethanolidurans TaxID=319653 RepID=UPI001C1EC16D|nr:Nif3-like dinuclear metal center hexameric protein [Pediococcus ethanolidurans]MBU7554934.1 Nif3-like dinuclear metal center hexameric protein [Pediococcus ethanolidurans]MBU7563240.1 Nif3-like dinuclear metal center hexameric protein [Pediococcus ethanolidurans]MCV3322113.1 Nif3-like dinuclear metal center hexameric protein [Pediococcus ethanolidurans]MCV3327488.1 Nif3-like dinuclear metal center hexameric protein [Pediococcus ethanolidurans]MCV3555115.1 Nif3-like dinuclear metal center he
MKIRNFVNKLEKFAPQKLAEPGDPVGLQIGNLDAEFTKILVTLDVRPEVVAEAIANHCELIIAHHPVMFHSAHNLDLANPQNQMYAQIIKHNITVYAAHSNLDAADNGMNDWLAEKIGLLNTQRLLNGYIDENGHQYGMGRIGNLATKISVLNFAKEIKSIFKLQGLRLVSSNPEKLISRVAVLGGDGGKFYRQALSKGAEIFVTGDVYYHTGHDMLTNGLNVVDPGHNIEKICIPKLTALFRTWNIVQTNHIEIVESKVNTNPFTFI